jgi:hypothetical protein
MYTKFVSVKTQLYLDNGFYVSKKATCIQNISIKTQLYLDNRFYVSKKATYFDLYTGHFQSHTIPKKKSILTKII